MGASTADLSLPIVVADSLNTVVGGWDTLMERPAGRLRDLSLAQDLVDGLGSPDCPI